MTYDITNVWDIKNNCWWKNIGEKDIWLSKKNAEREIERCVPDIDERKNLYIYPINVWFPEFLPFKKLK